MTEPPAARDGATASVDNSLPEGVHGSFDAAALKDYAPALESADPLMRVELQQFEGPLDLLLHLIKRDGMDIFDIPIRQICDAYVDALGHMRELNIDVAAEFLLMAATLAHIKSKMLLPKEERAADEDEDDDGDPRAELVRRLLEYQKYRNAAAALNARAQLARDVFTRPPLTLVADEDGTLAAMEPMRLVSVLASIFARTKKKIIHEVFLERMSVGARINELIDVCRVREHITFDELMAYGDDPIVRSKRVVTFLALLEMTRLKLVQLHQPSDRGTIYITPIRDNLDIDAAEIRSSFDEIAGDSGTDSSHVQ